MINQSINNQIHIKLLYHCQNSIETILTVGRSNLFSFFLEEKIFLCLFLMLVALFKKQGHINFVLIQMDLENHFKK